MSSEQQLVLSGLTLSDDQTLDNFFVTPSNAQAVNFLKPSHWSDWFVYLWGASSSGRSHLLNACGLQFAQASMIYLPIKLMFSFDPQEILYNLELHELVCIDDVDLVIGQKNWEHGLFNLFNVMQNKRHKLLVSASLPPKQLAFQLADLQSRFMSGTIFHIHSLTEEERLAALQYRAEKNGLMLTDEVAQFILKRSPRDLASLVELLKKLDKASLASKRKITVPFVKEALNW